MVEMLTEGDMLKRTFISKEQKVLSSENELPS